VAAYSGLASARAGFTVGIFVAGGLSMLFLFLIPAVFVGMLIVYATYAFLLLWPTGRVYRGWVERVPGTVGRARALGAALVVLGVPAPVTMVQRADSILGIVPFALGACLVTGGAVLLGATLVPGFGRAFQRPAGPPLVQQGPPPTGPSLS